MPGPVPGIHVLKWLAGREDVDGRDKPGHDEVNLYADFTPAGALLPEA
jgi:hypothetical protein